MDQQNNNLNNTNNTPTSSAPTNTSKPERINKIFDLVFYIILISWFLFLLIIWLSSINSNLSANSFMDIYVQYRNTLVSSKERYGQTLSINWPLWKEGGMSVDEWTEKMMTKKTGMVRMETAAGINAL